MSRNKIILGLTGSIATGKTTVSNIISKKGYTVIDADEISRHITKKDNIGYVEIIKVFGKELLDRKKEIDRKKLGDIIFNDSAQREKLNSILHPIVIDEIKRMIKESDENVIFVDIPLLFEIRDKLEQESLIFDEVILVATDIEIQIKRLMSRDKISYNDALAKISSQISIEEKRKMADIIIDNNGSEEELYQNVSRRLDDINEKYFAK